MPNGGYDGNGGRELVLVLSDAVLHPDAHVVGAGRTVADGDDRVGATADV
ncbi:MAG: hypothetical protein R2788_10800 [Saprospiraceae bacterium]